MNIKYTIRNLAFILALTLLSCETNNYKSDANGKTIKVINDQSASIIDLDDTYFLYFEKGIVIDSPNLLDTIHLLLPFNLPNHFKVNNQNVTVSGEIKENPGYSSHNNYTTFYIDKISK
jgi:hypothetical protein